MAYLPRAFRVSLLLLTTVSTLADAQRRPRPAPVPTAQRTAPPASAPIAAAPVAVDTSAWLYKGSDLPPDPAWSFGTLPNGLRYAVRRNGAPPGQVSVRVRIDAGSLMETDAERGFAHFIEHLTFRGSAYVADGEAKRVWQRLGATFGVDSNAQTTPTQTVYKLDLPGATAATLDESMHILSGMMAAPAITPAAITSERPVVLAEQREQPGPQVKLSDAINATFFAGQPLANRSPIGSIKTLEAATAPTVKAFHDRWYRPTRAVVIVSGDIDPAVASAAIVRNFASWQGTGAAPADPDFGKPDAAQPSAAALVEPGLPPLVIMGVVRPWKYQDDTRIFNQKRMIDLLAARVISRRLERRARAGGSFISASVSIDDLSRSANVTSVNILPVGDNWEAALKDVRAVIADAQASPPTQAEVDREYADFDTVLRTQVETERVEASAKQADDLADALDIRETVTAPETSYATLTDAKAKGMFTPETLFASSKKIFDGTANRALVVTRTPVPGATTTLAAALKADVTGLVGKRSQQAAVTFADLPRPGTPGRVTGRTKVPDLDLQVVTFANGVRAMIFPNASETGRVYVRVRFGGGYNALPVRPSPAWAADSALVASGIAKLDEDDIEQLTAGRRIGLDFSIDDDAFALGAMTSPADMPDQLRLMAAKLGKPGWDPQPVLRTRSVALNTYTTTQSSPDGVLSRNLDRLLHDGDPRWGQPNEAEIRNLTPAAFRKLWKPLLARGPIEVSVFGDIKADAAIQAVAATFGAMPGRSARAGSPPPIRFPAHNATPVVLPHDGPDTQGAAVIAWPTGGGIERIGDSRRLDVLALVFADRLFERLRQTAGLSYSPNVQSRWPVGLAGGGQLIAIGQVAPDKADTFIAMARGIAADLAANPVGGDELQRIMRPLAQQYLRASTANMFWMRQLTGGAFDPRRITATRQLFTDIVSITPAQLQETARKYLRPDTDWTLKVLPRTAAASAVPAAAANAPAAAAPQAR